ncbi:MAG: hypothetical protein ACFFCQ_05195, partial [Promethearchaeota archaeon]
MRSVHEWNYYFKGRKRAVYSVRERQRPLHSEFITEIQNCLGISKPKVVKGYQKTNISKEKVTTLREQLREKIRCHIALTLVSP